MNSNLKIGRIFGIPISISWSWLIIFALIFWSLASSVFPDQFPDLSTATYVIMGGVGTLLFFLSIVLHEVGHSIIARRNGIEIEGITLWLFGGVSQFKEMFKGPGEEFRIGIAGPAVSLVLGGAFLGLGILSDAYTPVSGTLLWLGSINLLLMVFNLLPALPLDGGRVLRAALWRAKRDFTWATKVAAGFGRGFGYLMIAGGLFMLFEYSAIGGLWLALIGWFLLGAAGGETRFARAREALSGLRVSDVMMQEPVIAYANETLGEFADSLTGLSPQVAYPVVYDDGSNGQVPVGLLPFEEIAAGRPRAEWDEELVGNSMVGRERVPMLAPENTAVEALDELMRMSIQYGLVVDHDQLVGLVSLADLTRALYQRSAFRRR